MGSSVSQETEETPSFSAAVVSRKDLAREAFNDIRSMVNPLDLLQMARNLPVKGEKLSDKVSRSQLLEVLNFREGSGDFVWALLKTMARWPLFRCHSDPSEVMQEDTISLKELVICSVLLRSEGLKQMKVDLALDRLVWMSLQTCERHCLHEDSQDVDIVVNSKGKIQWNILPIVQSFDEIEIIPVGRNQIRALLNDVLPLFTLQRGKVLNDETKDVNFTPTVNSMMRLLFGERAQDAQLSFPAFQQTLHDHLPRLLAPLREILDPLVQTQIAPSASIGTISNKTITIATFCQLNTIQEVGRDLLPLFVASQMGFSMRAVESHIFKYRAPTLMIIKGKVQTGFDKYKHDFFRNFPESRHNSGEGGRSSDSCCTAAAAKTVVLAIYVAEPWKITNSSKPMGTFGMDQSCVYELLPSHHVSRCTAVTGGVYFSTLGMGIGAGAPLVPSRSKVNAKAGVSFGDRPAGSVCVDTNLEYGNYKRADDSDVWFRVSELLVLGLGDVADQVEQQKQWEWERRQAEKSRHINDVQEGRALLAMAGLVGNHGSGGSV